MSNSKVERLTNLVIGLLSTRQYVTAERIHRDFYGYSECASKAAFDRMFERDKAELRDLGIPLTTGTISPMTEEVGYRIERSDYELPPISLTAEETAAVAVAGTLWQSPEMEATYSSAVVKLRAAGISVDDSDLGTVVGSAGTAYRAEPALADLIAAVDERQAVRFTHLAGGSGATTERTVEPWGVASAKGNWYLVGFDRDRQAQRTFRLSRIVSAVEKLGRPGAYTIPDGVDPHAVVRSVAAEPVSTGTATVWIEDGRANDLRRAGSEIAPHALNGVAGTVLRIPVGSRAATVRAIAAHGPHAVVLEPEDVRAEVIDSLRSAAAAHPPDGADAQTAQEEGPR